MKFLLQELDGKLAEEEQNVKDLCEQNNVPYIISSSPTVNPDFKSYTPVGSIPYVEKHLQTFFNIPQTCPLEVPYFLQKPEYLHRFYKILKSSEIKDNEYYFIKGVDHLKMFSAYSGNTSLLKKIIGESNIWCSISTPLGQQIAYEYRVFVHDNSIKAIKKYVGYGEIEQDYQTIDSIINTVKTSNLGFSTYSFDVMYIEDDPRAYLIEMHFISSLGTYGYKEKELLNMYHDTYEFFKSPVHHLLLSNRQLLYTGKEN